MENKAIIQDAVNSHLQVFNSFDDDLLSSINSVAKELISGFQRGNKVLICGNGGSAADAQHISAELVGRFVKERKPLPCIALTTDTSALTAIGNDYDFDAIFERQVEALVNKNDIVIGISTSGNSKNVIKAIEMAKSMGCITIALTGNNGGILKGSAKFNINVPSKITARIQEGHIFIGHVICEIIDDIFNNYENL
jgi:D-sedoheptulose 7-phosphate isomerase